MKRSLEHNLFICVLGFFVFWISNITYTILKESFGIDTFLTQSIYFFGEAISYFLIGLGLYYISIESKLLRSIFEFFIWLSIAKIGDEYLKTAEIYSSAETVYTVALSVYVGYKIYKSKK